MGSFVVQMAGEAFSLMGLTCDAQRSPH